MKIKIFNNVIIMLLGGIMSLITVAIFIFCRCIKLYNAKVIPTIQKQSEWHTNYTTTGRGSYQLDNNSGNIIPIVKQ